MNSLRDPVKVFANLAIAAKQQGDQNVENIDNNLQKLATERDIHVSAFGEISAAPDRCRVTFLVQSCKENVQDAKNSISRRLDYILQTLHNYQVKDSDIKVLKMITRDEILYNMSGEVTVTFVDVSKCQAVCNFLVEKLDATVKMSQPDFFHSLHRLESLRRQASLLAVENCKRKAQEIAQYVNQTLGQPITIREEHCQEWEGSVEILPAHDGQLSLQQRLSQATVTVNMKFFMTFELKSKSKLKAYKI